MKSIISTSFHAHADSALVRQLPRPGTVVETKETKHVLIQEREMRYRFSLHEHPFVQQLTTRLIEQSISGLQAADTDYIKRPDGTFDLLPDGKKKPMLFADVFSPAQYNPSGLVQLPYPVKDLDFSYSGSYSAYNWELFFHVPLLIAMSLRKNGQFAEAQKWFHYIFDPTDNSDGPTPQRFWKVRPFQYTNVQKIEDILKNLNTGADEQLQVDTIRSLEAWKDAPFRPHVVARYRPQAYMYKTVMAYLDNLTAWADSLFRQDTGESIDEAIVLYVLAANILGPRPQPVPKKGAVRPQTYANMRADLDRFGNAIRAFENDVLFDSMPHPTDVADNDQLAAVRGIGQALHFCVPRNDKLLSYWDTVADRLFKIRNSLNIQGIFRQLPLFEPPIDPTLLVRAEAAGDKVEEIISGLHQPLPLVRFELLIQKAAELCQEVKALGNSLLSAMEKEDGEAMAILRAKQEKTVLGMVEHIKYGQLQESIKAREGLEKSLDLTVQRYTYYEMQLGKKLDEALKAIPELKPLDDKAKAAWEQKQFSVGEPVVFTREIAVDIAQDLGESGGKIVSSFEKQELDASQSARDWQVRASTTAIIASLSHYIPTLGVDIHFWGMGGHMEFGGQHVGPAFQAISEYQKSLSGQDSYDSGHAGKIANFARREPEWTFQSNAAAGEINQIFKQLRAAQIREALAERELKNHQRQIEHSKAIEDFLNGEGTERAGKRTNKAHYAWMKQEGRVRYTQCYQLTFDVARQALRALQRQLGTKDLNYLQPSYLGGKESLLAGEKLYLDIKRMEMAFHEQNQREYELTKHVSLMQLDPLALLKLRKTGQCMIEIPESVFDMDGPGHYFRRIKNVAVSIPCVTGPYIGANCTLSLHKSSIRISPRLDGSEYARSDSEDNRFEDYYGTMQSIVTSSGQNDTGLFETNLRDERYLPLENAGAIDSRFHIRLPANPSAKEPEPMQFDYDTIADVILHIRYTAREGGVPLRDAAMKELTAQIKAANTIGSTRLFSVRQEFPSDWAKFKAVTLGAGQSAELSLNLREEHYPFWSKAYRKTIKKVDLFTEARPGLTSLIASDGGSRKDSFNKEDGLLRATLSKVPLPADPIGKFSFSLSDNALDDLWIALKWGDA